MARSTECPLGFAARPVWFAQAAATRSRPAPQARVERRPGMAAGREEKRLVLARDYIGVRASRRFPLVESKWAGLVAYSEESVECGAALSAARDPALKKRWGAQGPSEVERWLGLIAEAELSRQATVSREARAAVDEQKAKPGQTASKSEELLLALSEPT